MSFSRFPSIEQFRHVIRAVRERAAHRGEPIPKLTFRGTVKLHGTNASISYHVGSGELNFHSRSRTLSEGDDNMGFRSSFVSDHHKMRMLHTGFELFANDHQLNDQATITVFGEWCGRGIQKGVGISNIDPRFIAFAVSVTYPWENDELEEFERENLVEWFPATSFTVLNQVFLRISDVSSPYYIEIDFNQPELAQNDLIELTMKVEAMCPVAERFGHEGVGEGIVWTCATPGWERSRYWFKVKGEKHSVSKVKTLAAVDVEAIAAKNELIAAIVTENRLEQGWNEMIQQCGEIVEMKQIGDFIRWVFNDTVKEETDTIIASGFQPKDLGKPISDVAKKYFMKRFNS